MFGANGIAAHSLLALRHSAFLEAAINHPDERDITELDSGRNLIDALPTGRALLRTLSHFAIGIQMVG